MTANQSRSAIGDIFQMASGGPCIVARVDGARITVLTWEGIAVDVGTAALFPFPYKAAARDATVFVPDYDVPGVAEIVSLSVELMDDRKVPRSPLHGKFAALARGDSE